MNALLLPLLMVGVFASPVEASKPPLGPEAAADHHSSVPSTSNFQEAKPDSREPQIPQEFRQPEIPNYDHPESQKEHHARGSYPKAHPERSRRGGNVATGQSSVGRVLTVDDEPPNSRLPGDPIEDRSEAVKEIETQPQSIHFKNEVDLRTAVQRDPPPELSFRGERAPPKRSALVLFGYRHFFISDGLGRHQDWHIASIELAPFRRYFRLNILTEIGFEGGDAAAGGDRADLFVMEKAGIGVQYPHWVTPFVEFQGGIGVGRIELFERNDLALLASMGLDVGAQWSMVKHVYLMASVGWIRPYFMGFGGSDTEARYYDRATFKVGVGF